MKYIQFLLSLLFITTTISCDQIPCENVDCGEHGYCNESDGTCDCNPGFSINVSTGLCSCPDNSTYSDSAQLCLCDDGWLFNPLTETCVNPCDLLNCGLNGDCDFSTGDCICDDGYGPGNLSPCEAFNQKFVGTWTGSHINTNNSQVTGPYTMTLSTMQEPDRVLFQNFMNLICQGGGGTPFAVDADATIVSPGQSGGEFASPCIEWEFSNGSFELVAIDSLVVSVSVTPGLGGPSMNYTGSYTRN